MGNDALGRVNGYSKEYTALLVNSFSMGKQLSDNFWEQTKYDSQEIGGVLGLKNASDLIYDKNPKDLGLIQPPFLPNIRFAQYAPTQQLICWGSSVWIQTYLQYRTLPFTCTKLSFRI